MAASGSKHLPSLGFFTVTEDAACGFVGGLLVLNAAGRPLEFHCTAPLKPNRAQEILYGPTLRPFLYGEQIGGTLASKAKSDTLFLCTDVEPAMCLRPALQTPLVLVRSSDEPVIASPAEGGRQKFLRWDPPQTLQPPASSGLAAFTLGHRPVAVLQDFAQDREVVQEKWQPFAEHLDLWEPFGRIREALTEAQRGAAK